MIEAWKEVWFNVTGFLTIVILIGGLGFAIVWLGWHMFKVLVLATLV